MPSNPAGSRQRRAEPLAARICANPECGVKFFPDRVNQVFHTTPCRKDYWRKAVHWTPHACPLCTVVHDPEEAGVLDALQMMIRGEEWDAAGWPRDDVEAFIKRRREILATKPAAPA